MLVEMGGENGTIVPGDVGSGHQVEGVEIDKVGWDLVGGEFSEGIGPNFGERYGGSRAVGFVGSH